MVASSVRLTSLDRDLRDWIRGLVVHGRVDAPASPAGELSDQDAAYLESIVGDGALQAAFAEIAATEPDLAD